MRVLKYLRQYFKPSPDAVTVEESQYVRDGVPLRAVIYKPRQVGRLAGGQVRRPAWVVLHGLTATGADHPSLKRFASALAASGHVILIPEIVEWSKLHVMPSLTASTIEAAVDVLRSRDDVDPNRIGVFGFSFGATHAIAAAHKESLSNKIKAIVAWGGYSDLQRLVRFGLTGEHDGDGKTEKLDPDPYGRWMFGGNYLTQIPGYEDMQRVQDALLELARQAGRSGKFAGDPVHKPLIAKLAEPLNPNEREVYELFAPIGDHDFAKARVLAAKLGETIARVDPYMDPGQTFEQTRVPVLLAHGRDDRLVPYTESVRLQRRIPKDKLLDYTITSLFSHSGGTEPGLGPIGLARETTRFVQVLHKILNVL
ncbi:MAG TPA: alpha/beta fold hydrolase [Longimicrobiales bacterium]|nr:alpha/beta fold hydrolase [Longimicrobiales bacterium]